MGSLNSPGSIDIVTKQNASWRNEGGAIVQTSGLLPQTGPTSTKPVTAIETQQQDRDAAAFGTNADEDLTQRSTVCVGPGKKVTTSDDTNLDGGPISLELGNVAPDAANQPEIALKSITQRSTYQLGATVVVRSSEDNSLVNRNSNDGFTPGP